MFSDGDVGASRTICYAALYVELGPVLLGALIHASVELKRCSGVVEL